VSARYRRLRASRNATPPEHLDVEFTSAREEAECEAAVQRYLVQREEEISKGPIGARVAAEFERQRTQALLTRAAPAKATSEAVSEKPYLLDRTKNGTTPMYGPLGELLTIALEQGLRDLAPVAVALHPGLFLDVVRSLPGGITGNAWMAGAFALPTNVGTVRVVMAEALPERTGMVFGLKGRRALALSEP
jgi:hypothetical protein